MDKSPSEQVSPDVSSISPPSDGFLCQNHPAVPEDREVEAKEEMSVEEIKGTVEAIASTGKFWQDWEKLKGMLSCWLKKVLSEYPEAKMTGEEQNVALGETYSELVSRLGEALLSFGEGPPFTLQRLCEILLAARSIYPKLSKLALALEKNLLVTSMLSISTVQNTVDDAVVSTEDIKPTVIANGEEAMGGGDKDIIMTEVEEADVDDAMTIDMDSINEPSETTITTPSSENTATKQSPEAMVAEEEEEEHSRLPLPLP